MSSNSSQLGQAEQTLAGQTDNKPSRGKVRNSDRKTVTFGDSSAVRSLPAWSFLSLIALAALWYFSTRTFSFPDDFTQSIIAERNAEAAEKGTELIDSLSDRERIAACDGQPDCRNDYFQLVGPRKFPSPTDTWNALGELATDGFQNISLWQHTRSSLWRVLRGMFWGVLVGVPVGFAMGLSSRASGFFDTIVEGFRPIPPLALLPLFVLAFGIGDGTAVNLLIFASVWIMIIAARSGVRSANLSKVRAAYSLGASKWQVLTRVLLPNALPELFTGVRVAFGVAWGTLVAAELVGARDGLGQMIFAARAFFRLDVIWAGIIIIAILGVMLDMILRLLESRLIPWRGKG